MSDITECPDYSTECPDFDTLSAWYDGTKNDAVENHVANCEKCKAVVADFGIIQTATKISVPVPKDLNRAILEKCREQDVEDETSKKTFVTKVVIIVLIIIIACLIFASL